MTPQEQAKMLLPGISALANGDECQYRSASGQWFDLPADFWLHLSHGNCIRIKPKPKLRAWKPDECPNNFMIMRIGGGQGTTCVAWKNSISTGVNIMHAAISNPAHPWTDHVTFDELHRHYVRIDEQGNEHPCGVLEVEP